jgi:hypothetical protein
MKNPIAICILIVGLCFTALYGWLNRYEFYTSKNHPSLSLNMRFDRLTGTKCIMFPPKSFWYVVNRSSSLEIMLRAVKDKDWCPE